MKKLILLLLMFALLIVGIASSATVVYLNFPDNLSTKRDTSSVTYTFNVTGNVSTYTCNLNISAVNNPAQSSFTTQKSIELVNNYTSTTTAAILTKNGDYHWGVHCAGAGTEGWSGVSNYTLTVPAPTITQNRPTNASSQSDTTARTYNFTVAGNLDEYTCEINTSTVWNGTYTSIKTVSAVLNNTATASTPGVQTVNGEVAWKTICYNPDDSSVDVGIAGFFNYTLGVFAPIVTANAPLANAYVAASSVTFNWTVYGAGDDYSCELLTTENSSWVAYTTDSSINNNTATTRTRSSIGNRIVNWSVNCTDSTNTVLSNVTPGRWVTLDSIDPVVTILPDTPGNNTWLATGSFPIGLNVTDNNPAVCNLEATLNSTDNTTRGFGLEANQSYSNNTAFNFSAFGKIGTINISFTDNGTGAYVWNYVCNDSAGNSVTLGTNLTIFVDTTAPSAFNLSTVYTSPGNHIVPNMSLVTDYTPLINWTITIEANFSNYTINFYNTSSKIYLPFQTVITNQTIHLANVSEVNPDRYYRIMIAARDKAGNEINASADFEYNTTSLCHNLTTGWNICGNLGNQLKLGNILNETGASTVAYFNTTNEFVTYVSGGNGGNTTVPPGEAFFTYVNSSGDWEDGIHNHTALNRCFTALCNADENYTLGSMLRNRSNTDWNIVIVMRPNISTTFRQLDLDLNSNGTTGASQNVTFFSMYNNSAAAGKKYVPYVSNLTFNNNTPVAFGDTIWMFLGNIAKSNLTINWTDMDG